MNRFAHPTSRRPLIFGFVLVPAALSAATLAQNNQPPRSPDPPVLIWDIDLKLANALPRNFRTTNDPLNESKGETLATSGLSDLRASGSGEFTPEGLKLVLARTRGPVTVFDLRQETGQTRQRQFCHAATGDCRTRKHGAGCCRRCWHALRTRHGHGPRASTR